MIPKGRAHLAKHFKRLGACRNLFMVSCMEIKVKTVPFRPFLYDNLSFMTPSLIKSFLQLKGFGNSMFIHNNGLPEQVWAMNSCGLTTDEYI